MQRRRGFSPLSVSSLLCLSLAAYAAPGRASAALTLPDGSNILSQGTKMMLDRYMVSVPPGKQTGLVVQLLGGASAGNLALKANVYRAGDEGEAVKGGAQSAGMPHARLMASSVPADPSAPFVARLVIDATDAAPGYYVGEVTSGTSVVGTVAIHVEASSMIKASYIQLDATGSLGSITDDGYRSSNLIVFAFADIKSSSVQSANLAAMQKAIDNEGAGTINLLSIGGQYETKDAINVQTADKIVANVSAQIDAYNKQLKNGKIGGVDLDLENAIDSETIAKLARGFKSKGLVVSVAPQVITVDGAPVDPNNPANLGLSSGGNSNQYGAALDAGDVDYVLAQTYNTGGWKVGGVEENSVHFFTQIAKALNNAVKSSCTKSPTLCIPQTTQIVIGEVSNAGASGTVNNIFASNGSTGYDQAAVLSALQDAVPVAMAYPHVAGVMQWSLNNDYMPNGWNDKSAKAGAFTSSIFGAPGPTDLPYFIVQLSSTGYRFNQYSYGSVTMVVNGQYWIFGATSASTPSGMMPIAPQGMQQWGTLTSSKNPATPGVADSATFDQIFGNGATSFTASQLLVNAYNNGSTEIDKPSKQWSCSVKNYKFEANHSYNLLFNPINGACDVRQMN